MILKFPVYAEDIGALQIISGQERSGTASAAESGISLHWMHKMHMMKSKGLARAPGR